MHYDAFPAPKAKTTVAANAYSFRFSHLSLLANIGEEKGFLEKIDATV